MSIHLIYNIRNTLCARVVFEASIWIEEYITVWVAWFVLLRGIEKIIEIIKACKLLVEIATQVLLIMAHSAKILSLSYWNTLSALILLLCIRKCAHRFWIRFRLGYCWDLRIQTSGFRKLIQIHNKFKHISIVRRAVNRLNWWKHITVTSRRRMLNEAFVLFDTRTRRILLDVYCWRSFVLFLLLASFTW